MMTKKDVFPVPNNQEVLDDLQGSKYYSVFDLNTGYWQVKMDPESREYTAFSTPDGHGECLKMAFGLANTPACFMRLMSKVLSGLIEKFVRFTLMISSFMRATQ
jgi:hypothetical protein